MSTPFLASDQHTAPQEGTSSGGMKIASVTSYWGGYSLLHCLNYDFSDYLMDFDFFGFMTLLN